ncbi:MULTISPECIES: VOC family protein [Gammaproteobacteria]|uniref:VOC family protein n=1 Tax=Gammaproteobacteria TaxID=1236 RepID=UPI000DD03A91|nr:MULTISPECIES: VOC family protein [Gammaproteobacteria]RTE87724.1 VOC family protein [Aliidiomarina sp. B3213]TCZ92494.1 VOC family protein [Lysobacter sp. N42]
MEATISYITLGVSDLKRAVEFYQKVLGLKTKGIIGEEFNDGAVAFFKVNTDLTLALWPRESLARQCGVPLGSPNSSGLLLAHNVGSTEKVDQVIASALKAGATLTKEAAEFPWGGYGGVFMDLDGHLWEVVFNPNSSSNT